MTTTRLTTLLGLTLALAGCGGSPAPSPVATTDPSRYNRAITPQGFRLPEGSGCGGEISRYQAVVDNDLRAGQVNQPVYNQIKAEIDRASGACAAGHEAEAHSLLLGSKGRHGYPAG